MIKIGNGVSWSDKKQASPSGPFTKQYQAILNKAISLGYTLPSFDQQILQDQLIRDLKAHGIWFKLDLFYNFATDAGSAFATINWKNPDLYQATLFNSISFSNNQGFTGNGVNTYIDTGFNLVLGTNYTQNNASRYVYGSGDGVQDIFDGNANNSHNTFRCDDSTNQKINQALSSISPSLGYSAGLGMKSIHRTSASDIVLIDNLSQATRTVTSKSLINSTQLVFRSQTQYGDSTIYMYAVGASLVNENSDFVQDYNNYINSL
jgi:hypothetical protein